MSARPDSYDGSSDKTNKIKKCVDHPWLVFMELSLLDKWR